MDEDGRGRRGEEGVPLQLSPKIFIRWWSSGSMLWYWYTLEDRSQAHPLLFDSSSRTEPDGVLI